MKLEELEELSAGLIALEIEKLTTIERDYVLRVQTIVRDLILKAKAGI